MDVLKNIRRNGGINSEVSKKFTCFNILCHAAKCYYTWFYFCQDTYYDNYVCFDIYFI